MASRDKIYFASDFHLGIPDAASSRKREDSIIRWLDFIKNDASELFLVGDIFDFWYEYKHVVPKGSIRLLGKLAELSDSGVKINVFTGNHDMWLDDYLVKEINVELFKDPVKREWNGKKFLIGHGDGLGPGDYGYKFIKKIFANPVCRFLFRWLHPDIGVPLANFWSGTSRTYTVEEKFLGEEKEWLLIYCRDVLKKEHFDFFIFGHRHLALDLEAGKNSRYINLGHWLHPKTYAVFDGTKLELKTWENT